MVMRPLWDMIMVQYIYDKQIDPFCPTGNVFGYNNKGETRIWRIFVFPALTAHVALRRPTFEINGHGASVWYHWYTIHIFYCKLFHITQLVAYLGIPLKKKPKFGAFLCHSFCGTFALRCPTFQINGHGISVWCHCDNIHILGTNWSIKPDW